ncbi:RING-type E3 ubiquitin-protein ligase PPIL2 [Halyomorpha halys]|uniref:RING-type E3 ubiquitin-protein ligase PPIL2 n=1 Tax=Halyomorpha halys TaxID=286706 RepID=UPI0006D50FF4|nr:peptidyl-prolyl cis-trans isomerase-like 2 [Halyomorpha halys]
MGKRQHQKDKMYLTYSEWGTLYGGKKPEKIKKFRRLPFDHCCLSLRPFENPYCDKEGNIFDLEAILEYLKKNKINPVTGKPLDAKSLIKLNFSRDNENKLQCPILFKTFTQHSHVVVVQTTGNVFSNEAVEELNLKINCWKDLVNDVPFNRSDLLTLQDPDNLQKFNMENFYHIKVTREAKNDTDKSRQDRGSIKNYNKETQEILSELKREYKPKVLEQEKKPVADKINAAHYSTGHVAAGLTSTTMVPETKIQAAILKEDDVRYERVNKKGYVRLITNLGPLNVELHCNIVPKTCENFIKLCQKGYYNSTIFHRSIRHFMIQGGDPTGTGTGGESFWGKPFEDDIKPHLKHSGRGVLSMANSGPNTNKSQFFITYRSCRHLDGKHTVFGQIVGGLDTLNKMEKIEVDNKDKPIEDIIILAAQVFVDPFQEADEKLAEEREKAALEEQESKEVIPKRDVPLAEFKSGIGKYINPKLAPGNSSTKEEVPVKKKKITSSYSFDNFNNW